MSNFNISLSPQTRSHTHNSILSGASVSLKIVLVALFVSLSLDTSLPAQSAEIHWSDQGTYQIGYQFSSADSPANTPISVNLYLETNSPTEGYGGAFDLDLDEGVNMDPDVPFTFPTSNNLGDPEELEVFYELDSTLNEAHFRVYRKDSVEQGISGVVLVVHCKTGSSPVDAEAFVEAFSGPILVLENVDMKQNERPVAARESLVEIKMFPNPCTDWIQIEPSGATRFTAQFIDLKGTIVKESRIEPGHKIRMTDIDKGIWFVRVLNANKDPIGTCTIIKQ